MLAINSIQSALPPPAKPESSQSLTSPKLFVAHVDIYLILTTCQAFMNTIQFNPHSNLLTWALLVLAFYQGRGRDVGGLLKQVAASGDPGTELWILTIILNCFPQPDSFHLGGVHRCLDFIGCMLMKREVPRKK